MANEKITEAVRTSAAEKLSPKRLRTSAKFTAMLAFLLDEDWANPKIVDMNITSDGFINVLTSDQNFIGGEVGDLIQNIHGVADAAGLTPVERAYLLGRVKAIRA